MGMELFTANVTEGLSDKMQALPYKSFLSIVVDTYYSFYRLLQSDESELSSM